MHTYEKQQRQSVSPESIGVLLFNDSYIYIGVKVPNTVSSIN